MTMTDDLIRLTAVEAVRRLKQRKVSPLELIDAALRRIDAVDGGVNALPTRCIERARERAGKVAPDSLLAGLPISVKDLVDVAGVRTTYGSPIYAARVPDRSDVLVERLEANGALVIAKSNTPEFGAGANTFNPVFGKTRNPWNMAMSSAGSSGGAAVSLATGQVWLATGSDLGGSLRTPASFCGVVGLRPSPGRVAHGPFRSPPFGHAFDDLIVDGPMGRNVADVALMLDAMVGASSEDPLSLAAPAESFLAAVEAARPPRRVAFSPDLGLTPVDPEIRDVCAAAAMRFQDMGGAVDQTSPDFSGAKETFQVLRAELFASDLAPLLESDRDKLKPDVIWNLEKGLTLTGADIARANRERGRLYNRVAQFFQTYDVLVCPTAIVPPFPVDQRYVEEVAGHRFENYVDWIAITYAITLTSCPAISIPCGFTRAGLPIGLQLVGRPHGEHRLLAAAHLLEQILGLSSRLPIEPRNPT
jgi:amidase